LIIVSVVILNWNAHEVTETCLNSLLVNTECPECELKIVVVDNGSLDGSPTILDQKYHGIADIVPLRRNLGFAAGCNMGIEYAMSHFAPDYILLLNNDTILTQKRWLCKLIEAAKADSTIGIVGPKLVFPNGKVQWSGRARELNVFALMFQIISAGFNPGVGRIDDKDSRDLVGYVNTVSGACLMMKSSLIRSIGLLDYHLAPMFGEDVEYCYRAWKNGYRVFYRGDATVIHAESYTIEKFGDSLKTKKTFWTVRSSLRISRKYFGFWRTLLFGIPMVVAGGALEKRDKTLGLKKSNIRLKHNFWRTVPILLAAIRDAFFYDVKRDSPHLRD